MLDNGVFGTVVGVHVSSIPAGKNKTHAVRDENHGYCAYSTTKSKWLYD